MPRRGEFDADARLQELEGDGIAGEVIFPQMAPFGAGLTQYRNEVSPEHNLEEIVLQSMAHDFVMPTQAVMLVSPLSMSMTSR